MLKLQSISKEYKTGELVQKALSEVSLTFRENEFVSVLGPSGSGKTTLLNIIGGLDHYDSGDLVINGVSTKKYKDRDWDTYRNHTIGFVFQSYNLIPHQSVLANVELALTIGGVSRKERRKRAKEALEEVGLGDQLHKKPNQMSGGQMQRVAIARSLVNNPDILLADEPTGALDTETSVQVMELLKKVAEKRLVIMVTHNPELAEEYSTRIVNLRDGKIVSDTNPVSGSEQDKIKAEKDTKTGKAKMSFLTSLSLSIGNLKTKKGRTLLTSFAGSIGIIGIALILALSSGVNDYIGSIQKDTMSSYPITINAETVDVSSIMSQRGSMMGGMLMGGRSTSEETENKTGVYVNTDALTSERNTAASITENDLTAFKKYLDDPNSEIAAYIGETGVIYNYDVNFEVYTRDSDGSLVNTNADTAEITGSSSSGTFGMMGGGMGGGLPMMGGTANTSSAENFSELMKGTGEETVSRVITDSYELLAGAWPTTENEVVLVLDENNSIDAGVLYQLGFMTAEEYKVLSDEIASGEEPESTVFDYEDILAHTFYLIPACDRYQENEDGTFSYIGDGLMEEETLLDGAIELKITGVIRPMEDAANANISTAVGYTSLLTDYIISHTNDSAVILAQEASPDINVLNGMEYEVASDEEKIEDAKAYIETLGISDKASLYQMIQYLQTSSDNEASQTDDTEAGEAGPSGVPSDAAVPGQAPGIAEERQGAMDETTLAEMLDRWVEETPDDEILIALYDDYVGGASYADNMSAFGKVSYDAPSSISIYTDSFEAKEAVQTCIENYNKTVDSDTQITYTDYVALMTSSITSIVDVISYVLIAFVAVSLIVSCIMIGIITHISVLERTKEIGILRALGASKRNISQVFNAETVIIGLCSGLLGVGISMLLTIPINAVLGSLLGASEVQASLPITYGLILILISVVITVIGGLLPARKAAKKDPVIALRTE